MRLAFVTPRYGAQMVGGAEAQVREAAHGLAARGHDVEVLTTVAVDAQTWEPTLEHGASRDGSVTVRRFETVPGADRARRDALDRLVLSGRPLAAPDELAWIDARFQVPDLLRHLVEEGAGYDAVVYSPYLFWTTLRGLPLTRTRSVLVPCLHDEPMARLRSVRATLAAAGEVWFLSEPEHQLAHRLAPLGPHRVVGSAVPEPEHVDPDGFRRRHRIDRPFVLCAGRREDGKGWPQALAGFATALDRHPLDLDLVTIGAGEVQVAGPLAARVRDLGFLDAAEVPSAFAAAAAFLQPSPNESFSRTVMEAWLAGVPVVASAAGEVVAWHCERSGGGLLYGDEIEMAECLQALVEDPQAAAGLGARGRAYVRAHCSWPAVLDRMEEALRAMADPPVGSDVSAETPVGSDVSAETLSVRVRGRAAAARQAVLAPGGGIPLEEWVPVPGAGASPTMGVDDRGPLGAAPPASGRGSYRRPLGTHRRRQGGGALAVVPAAGGGGPGPRAAWTSAAPVAPARHVR